MFIGCNMCGFLWYGLRFSGTFYTSWRWYLPFTNLIDGGEVIYAPSLTCPDMMEMLSSLYVLAYIVTLSFRHLITCKVLALFVQY